MTKEPMRKATTGLVIQCYREKYRIQRDIDEFQLEILEIETEMSGLAHHGTDMSAEQLASPFPMPSTVSPTHDDQRMLDLIERKAELEARIDWLVYNLKMAGMVSKLKSEDQSMMHDVYHSPKKLEDIAYEYGYHVNSVHPHLRRELDKVL